MANTNYHTHTYRCRHALGKDEEFVLNAITAGYTIFGFSDHCPFVFGSDERDFYRMPISELPDYLSSIKQLREKYKNELCIYLGVEAEYLPDRIAWLRKLKEEHLDFLVFGNHYHKRINSSTYFGMNWEGMITSYLDDSYQAISSGLYDLYAHPDLFLGGFIGIDKVLDDALEKICQWSKEFDIPLEYNLTGYVGGRKYPSNRLFQLAAKYQAPVMVSGDFHYASEVLNIKLYQERKETLRALGCRVIEELKL